MNGTRLLAYMRWSIQAPDLFLYFGAVIRFSSREVSLERIQLELTPPLEISISVKGLE